MKKPWVAAALNGAPFLLSLVALSGNSTAAPTAFDWLVMLFASFSFGILGYLYVSEPKRALWVLIGKVAGLGAIVLALFPMAPDDYWTYQVPTTFWMDSLLLVGAGLLLATTIWSVVDAWMLASFHNEKLRSPGPRKPWLAAFLNVAPLLPFLVLIFVGLEVRGIPFFVVLARPCLLWHRRVHLCAQAKENPTRVSLEGSLSLPYRRGFCAASADWIRQSRWCRGVRVGRGHSPSRSGWGHSGGLLDLDR